MSRLILDHYFCRTTTSLTLITLVTIKILNILETNIQPQWGIAVIAIGSN